MNKTNSSALIVQPSSGTNATATNDIRDIKAPLPIPSGWTWTAWVLGAAVLAALICWSWKRWRKKKAEPKPEVVIPPHEKARQKLRQALALIDQPRLFCIAVSDTIRTYLEERFSLHAPERTTEEFLDELQASPVLMFDQKQTLGEFLARCDLVKFARYEPPRAELEALYNAALRLIEETEPTPQPTAPPAGSVDSTPPALSASKPQTAIRDQQSE